MADTIIKGDELMIFKGGSALAYATSHTLSITCNTIDVSSKDHGLWGASDIGNIKWEATTECLYTNSGYTSLFNAMIANTPVTIVFAKASNYDGNGLAGVGTSQVQSWTAGAGFTGQAVITTLEVNANSGENATYSATFTGTGALAAYTPPNE